MRVDEPRATPVAAGEDHSEAEAPAAARRPSSVWPARLIPPALFLLAAMYCYSGFLADPRHQLIGGADGVAYAWYLEWVHQSILHGHNPFFTTALNAPQGVNLMWNTSLELLGLVCLPLVMTVGPFVTVGIMMTLAPFLSATSAYLVFRRLTGATVGPAIGATLYGFGPYFVGHHGHLNLILVPVLPVLLLICWNLFVTQTRSAVQTGLILGALVGLQMLLSEEIIVLAVVAALPMVALLALLNRHEVAQRLRHSAVGICVAAALAIAISIVPLAFQLFGPMALKQGVTSGQSKADVASLVRGSVLQRFASQSDKVANLHFPANGAENTGFLGWPLIVACLAMCIWLLVHRDRFARWWLPATAVVIALSFGTHMQMNGHPIGSGPWNLYRVVPFLDSAQVVRLSLITTLMIGLLIAWTMAQVPPHARLVVALVVTATLIPLFPLIPYISGRVAPTPRFFSTSAVRTIPAGATTMVLPMAGFPRVDAMVWQVRAHMRFDMVGGYSVFKNGDKSTFFPKLPFAWNVLAKVDGRGTEPTDAEVSRARLSLQEYKISYIIVTRTVHNFDLLSAAVARIGECQIRAVADVNVCEVGLHPK